MNQADEKAAPIDVVIAEDSRIQAKLLQRRLLEAGYHARIGKDSIAAWQQIRERPPTIVISDIDMPEMDGYELTETL